MRAVIQRVSRARVLIGGLSAASINLGLVVLLGVGKEDEQEDVVYMTDKICNLRVFEDNQGKMNLTIKEAGGQLLLISQFTLYGDCRKGRRPNFMNAAAPEKARPLYEMVYQTLCDKGLSVEAGVFGARMTVEIENSGPVTLLLDSQRNF